MSFMNAVSSPNQILQIIADIIVISICFVLFPRKKNSKKIKIKKALRNTNYLKPNLLIW